MYQENFATEDTESTESTEGAVLFHRWVVFSVISVARF